jgi:two-component system, OmpR family, sensor histidine kinase ArlS
MPVRLRITLLFSLLVFIILGVVCGSIYFFSYKSRIKAIEKRLTNRAITTARLLSQSGYFDRRMVGRIDSLTTLSLTNKSVQAFNSQDQKLYDYADAPADTLHITAEMLEDARAQSSYYFTQRGKEAIAYYYVTGDASIVIICGAKDVDGETYLAHLKNILLLSFIAGMTIAILGGYLFSGQLLAPIRKITYEVTEISAQNLTRRVPTGDIKDEWYYLADTLNDLLNRIQESFELQRRFISNASHELSTPLTSISSQVEIALQRERTKQEYEAVLTSILQDVRHLNKLTLTLLEFAKAAGNKGGLNLDLVRIDEILMDMPSSLRKQNADYRVSLQFDLPENEDDLLFFGNAELVSTAIKNIVANACKFSPDHRTEISLKISDKNFNIAIKDNGPGIPASEIKNIFQPFYRLDDSRSSEGFGLGLSLTYRIIKLHRGEITVHSNPGAGTVFNVQIPSAKRAAF